METGGGGGGAAGAFSGAGGCNDVIMSKRESDIERRRKANKKGKGEIKIIIKITTIITTVTILRGRLGAPARPRQ